ncbi:hypothetical protein J9S84_004801 [Salmonella enterica]|uniref:hypothetical protein n=1 Tax=Salmonella enterica TaxID=28901 RepID=UPI0009735E88|nr:hypothetical protein [Salmonella enterica]EBE2904372.1 hypothetical protein [Salmonella enterica subsp. enterica serovar Krefeld]EDQ2562678.1 hypothetical protein [Salmonella enterica subsp. enterica serovar Langensalza]EDT5369877.1 hypothetical protein [Salmonella enterica subsp. enterica]APY72381.1 hypothetical protein LFZ24_08540 [Salmonella enterica subsp. enterica serovar Krefeld str. SA20030536]EAY9606482.1 hypothetical protein [Salmonella enterica]
MINDMTQYGNNLAGNDPLSVMSNGQSTPDQIKQLYELSQDASDIQGLGMGTVVDTGNIPANTSAIKLAKAKNAFKNGGLNFRPPSMGRMFSDMLGGLLIAYAATRLLGGDSKASLAIGLLAAGGNHDADQAEQERFRAVSDMIGKVPQEAIYNYMRTGDDKALQTAEGENNKREDALQSEKWRQQDALQNHEWNVADKEQAFNDQMKLAQFNQSQENARAAMQENRADARAMAKNAGNVQGPTPYGYYSDTDGDGKPDTWVVTTSRGTPDTQNGNVHQLKLTVNGWVDQGYQPLVGAGGNTKSDTAAQTSNDVIDKALPLAKMNYSTASSSIGRGVNSIANWGTGHKHDFNTRADVLNNSMAALLADRAVNSTGGKSVLREDMQKQTESGGKISASNSPEVNQEILNNNINLVAGVQYINEYQNDHHGQMPSIDDYKKGRDKKRADIYKAHPELLNAFGESNDLPGQSGNINSYPSADKTDYSKLWK